MKSRVLPAFLFCFALAPVLADDAAKCPEDAKPSQTAASAAKPAEPAGTAGGLTVFIDPVTKKIRQPEPGEVERLLGSQRRPLTAPRPLTNLAPGAGVGLALDSSYEMFMVVTKKPDGTLATTCVTGDTKAVEVVNASPKAEPVKAREAGDAHAH